jgi:hypothetical protein
MASNRTPTRFYGPALLSSTPGTIYTVPANKIAVIKLITMFPNATDQVTITLNGTGSDDIVHYSNLPSDITVDAWKYVVAVASDTIGGFSDADSTAVTIDGDLYDV